MLKDKKDSLYQVLGLRQSGWLIAKILKRQRFGDEMNILMDMNNITFSHSSQWTWIIFQKLSNQFYAQLIVDFDLIKELLKKEILILVEKKNTDLKRNKEQ